MSFQRIDYIKNKIKHIQAIKKKKIFFFTIKSQIFKIIRF